MAIPIQLRRNGTAASTPSSLLHGEVALNYADGKLFWKDASNVIQSFTFQSYALSSHTHAASDVTSGTFDAARLPLATTIAAGAVIVGTGLGVSSGTVSVTYGTTSGTACQGNDSRLSDTRTPTDGSVTTAKIANDAVTYAKLQNVSAGDRLLGRSSAGAGDVEEITCTAFGRSLIDDADAAAARTTLSVQPTASPAFTGAATFDNTGNVVPLTVTNTGTANSFVVNDASGDTTPFVIDADGRVVIGATSGNAFDKFTISGTLPSSSQSSVGFASRGTIPSTSSNAADYFVSSASTQAASFTLTTLEHYVALQGTFGAGSVVTNQYGFVARDTLTGATNNYGFYSNIASGSGRWNFYSNGTAPSFFGGQLLVTAGSASAPGVAFGPSDTNTGMFSPSADVLAWATAGSERVRVDADGRVQINRTSPLNQEMLTVLQASVKPGVVIKSTATSGTAEPSLYLEKQDNNNTTAQKYVLFAYNAGVNGAGGIEGNGGTGAQFFASSDERLKENIADLAPQLANIMAMKPRVFDYISGPTGCTGFVAQELEEIYPDAVGVDAHGYKTIGGISIMETRIISAIQELAARIAALEERLNHA